MIARMISSLYVQLQKSSMVPFVGAVLDTPWTTLKTSLQTASRFISEKRKLGRYASFPCRTTQGRKKPLKRSQTKIKANAPQNQNEKHPLSLPTNGYAFPFYINIRFLHACTPARRMPARLHSYTRLGNKQTVGYQTQKNISFKKNVGGAQTLGNDSSGGASKPHRSKYMSLHDSSLFYQSF